jgi:hypothetical protein
MALNAAELLAQLQRTNFRGVTGARVFAYVPISRSLLNEMVAGTLPADGLIRRLDIRPLTDDRFDVVVTTSWSLVPPMAVTLVVERQPAFPAAPSFVLRWSLAPGLHAIASQFVGSLNHKLPRGIQLEGDRIVVDVAAVALGTPMADVVPFIAALRVRSIEERAVIEIELRPPDGA